MNLSDYELACLALADYLEEHPQPIDQADALTARIAWYRTLPDPLAALLRPAHSSHATGRLSPADARLVELVGWLSADADLFCPNALAALAIPSAGRVASDTLQIRAQEDGSWLARFTGAKRRWATGVPVHYRRWTGSARAVFPAAGLAFLAALEQAQCYPSEVRTVTLGTHGQKMHTTCYLVPDVVIV